MQRLLATVLAAMLVLPSAASAAVPPVRAVKGQPPVPPKAKTAVLPPAPSTQAAASAPTTTRGHATPAPAPAAGSNDPVKVQLPKPGPNTPPAAKGEPPAVVGPEDAKGPDRKRMAGKGLFQLDFDKVEIDKLVQTISDMTGKLFILPENVRGKITIIGPEHGKAGVTAEEAYQAFLSALDANGLTLYPAGKYLKIVEKRTGKQSNIPTLLDEDAPYTTNEQMVTKLFKLHYVDAEPVRAVIQQLVSRDGDTIAFPPDTIIVNDIGLNMHRLEKIIDRLDAITSTDEIRIIQVQYASANDIAEKLRQVFEEKNKKPGQRSGQAVVNPAPGAPPAGGAPASGGGDEAGAASLQQIIADERSNKLIIIANDRAFQRIQELLKHLDTPIPGEGQVHVYYLVNANAEELASTLASLTQGIANKPARPAGQPGGAAKTGGGGAATVADLFSGEVKITADKGTNALVVIASNSDYRNLVSVIEKLDIARRQVFIEAVIMEVNLSNDLSFGMGMHAGDTTGLKTSGDSLLVAGSELGKSNSLSGILSLASLGGFLAGLQGPNVSSDFPIPSLSIVLHALQSNSDVNVISTPHILATDNEDAEITVGQNVPFQSGVSTNYNSLTSATSGSSALSSLLGSYGGLYTNIQRQNVELKLKIKPQINESDFIRLQVDEQTEEIASKDEKLGPTTSKRTAKTVVVARDQQTVVIGGLIQERAVKSVQKVPLLGDIPVLGWLFRDNGVTKQRTNLLLFLTPYIVRDQSDFQRIFERKLKERQEFVEQFYGRQPGYKVPIDYTRKAGPLSKMFRTMETEAKKLENGGEGLPSEKLFKPKGDGQAPAGKAGPQNPPPPADLKSTPPGEPASLPSGTEVKEPVVIEVQ